MPPGGDDLWVCQLGLVEYREALALQERVRTARQSGVIADTLLLLEHPPVYTRGRRSQPGELPFGEDWYRARGIDIVDVDRGGKLTYHGPGQLVGYPIMQIVDVIVYLRTIEQAIVATLGDAGLQTRGRPDDGPDYTGVWTGDRKIASIGVHVARGVTTHGFAINVANDLEPFAWVVPCGLDGVSMTSLRAESQVSDRTTMPAIRTSIAERFAESFERRLIAITAHDLESALRSAAPLR
ncbi:MAG: lipoyl(octanoyl) transferase LipB [Solirubrobacterales bacterium]|nr:lipoyl(octanoyl) transferase LipB [Solirubrobacterales bacterium]